MLPARTFTVIALVVGLLTRTVAAQAPAPSLTQRFAVLLQAEDELAKKVQGQAASYVMREIAALGANVVDPANLAMVRDTWSLAKLDQGTVPRGLNVMDADVIVFISLSVSNQGKVRSPSNFLSIRVAMETRWLEVETGRVLGGKEIVSTGFGLDEATGSQDAATRAAKELAIAVRDGLAKLATGPRKIDLLVQNAGGEVDLPAVSTSLGKLSGVADISVIVRSAEVSRLGLSYSGGDGLALASVIDAQKAVPLRVVQATKASVITSYAPMRANRVPTQVGAVFTKDTQGWSWLRATLPEIVATHLSNLDYVDATPTKRDDAVLNVKAEVTPRDARRAQVTLTVFAKDEKKIVGVTGEIEAQAAATQLGELSTRLTASLEARVKEKPALVAGLSRAAFREAGSSLRIVSAQVDTVLPSRLGAYAKEGLLSLRVENKGKSKIDDVTASVFVPKLMSLPSQTSVGSLAPMSNRVVPLTATLDADAVGKITEQAPVQISVEIRGRQGDAWITSHRVVPAVVLEAGAVDWGDTANAAAFVTPGAAQVRELTLVLLEIGYDATPPEVGWTASVVDALATLGIQYRPDPKTPFRAARIDNIQLPAETLARGTGDCDDLSVLTASLLEALGVRTLLVATPEHILVAASTGIPADQKTSVPYRDYGWLTYDEQLWIPIEATKTAEGFMVAWRAGASEISNKKKEIVDVWHAWTKFSPVPFATTAKPRALVRDPFAKKLNQTATALNEQWDKSRTEEIARLQKELVAKPHDVETLVALGRVQARAAELPDAITLLRRALEEIKKARNVRLEIQTLELLGTALAARGETEEARSTLERAEKLGQLSGPGYANLGILHVLGKDPTAAKQAFTKGAKSGGIRALERVARAPASVSRKGNPAPSTAAKVDGREVRQMVEGVLDALIKDGSSKESSRVFPMGGSRGSADEELATSMLQWP